MSMAHIPTITIQPYNYYNEQRTDDVLKARLKTVGVSEHRFHMEAAAGRESGTEWRIVDVGGSRSQVSLFPFPFLPSSLSFETRM